MDIQVKNRKPQCEWLRLGVQGDNNVELVRFILPRFTGNQVDLYLGMAYVGFILPDGSEHLVSITEDYKEATDDNVVLSWIVGNEATAQPGRISIAIKISGLEGELWKSEKAYCTVADTIPMESPQREIYRSLRPVSNVVALPRIASPDVEPPITISERSIIIPQELQNIAVQNDQNSETVKIVCPRYFDGNDLSQYDFFLHTVSTGGENPDIVFLGENKIVDQTQVTLIWTLRPPETSYAGRLTIQLKISGINFQWSTDSASVNIIHYQEGDPVIPVTPGFVNDFLKEITVIRNSAKDSETAAKTSQTNAEQSATNAENSAKKSKKSADDAALSATNAETSKGNADTAALAAKTSETKAAGSVALAKDEVDKAKNEADRAKNEADRSKAEADRASGIVGGDYANKVKDAMAGNLVVLTSVGDIADSGKGLDDVGKVKSVFGREGKVVAQGGDYAAEQISLKAIEGWNPTTVQEAVNSLKGDADGVRKYFTPEGEAKSAAALNGIAGKPVTPYAHAKAGSVHNLTGPTEAALIYFTATDVYQDGDTWTLNGAPVTAAYHDGQALLPTAVIAGDVVEAVIEGDALRLMLQKPTPQKGIEDNGLFEVNQQNQNEYTSTGPFVYGVDRWMHENGTLTVTSDGIQVKGTTDSNGYKDLRQFFLQAETPLVPGGIYTATALIRLNSTAPGYAPIFGFGLADNGAILDSSCPQITGMGQYRLYINTITVPEDFLESRWSVAVTMGANQADSWAELDIAAIKIEQGPRFTGWYKPKPGETLAECQRYYEKISNAPDAAQNPNNFPPMVILPVTGTAAYIMQSWKVEKRVVPRIKVNGKSQGEIVSFRNASNSHMASGTLAFWNENNKGKLMRLAIAGGSISPFQLDGFYEAEIEADANIY